MMQFIRSAFAIVVLITGLVFSMPSGAVLQEKTYYRVERVIDGDTLRLEGGVSLRLIGIDTPERKENDKMLRDIRKRGGNIEEEIKAGLEAYRFTKKLVEGQQIHLEFDEERQDKYKRVLAYVFLKNGLFVNAEIVRKGYARAYPIKPNTKHAKLFRRLYQEAQKAKRGLWALGEGSAIVGKKSVYK